MSSSEPSEIPLAGGRANAGQVVRIGDEVARPTYPQTETVEHFMAHLRVSLGDLIPEVREIDAAGRQRLQFIEGRVPIAPHPAWAYHEQLLVDVAKRQRDLHVAAANYQAPADSVWAVSAGNYFPPEAEGTLVCHNDLGLANTIVDPHSAAVVGFIDFDYCRPVNRLFDIAVAARHWVPFGSLGMDEPLGLDRVRRFGLFCDTHELDTAERAEVIDLAIAFLEHARRNIKDLAAQGKPGFEALLAGGYEAENIKTVRWIADTFSSD